MDWPQWPSTPTAAQEFPNNFRHVGADLQRTRNLRRGLGYFHFLHSAVPLGIAQWPTPVPSMPNLVCFVVSVALAFAFPIQDLHVHEADRPLLSFCPWPYLCSSLRAVCSRTPGPEPHSTPVNTRKQSRGSSCLMTFWRLTTVPLSLACSPRPPYPASADSNRRLRPETKLGQSFRREGGREEGRAPTTGSKRRQAGRRIGRRAGWQAGRASSTTPESDCLCSG